MAADFLRTDYLFLAVGIVGGACSDVEQTFIEVTKFSKRDQLLDILKTTGSVSAPSVPGQLLLPWLVVMFWCVCAGTERTMVFVETKRQADFIAVSLCQEKIPTTSIHGYLVPPTTSLDTPHCCR